MSSRRPAISISRPGDVKDPPSSQLPPIKIQIGNTTTTSNNEIIIHEVSNYPVTFLTYFLVLFSVIHYRGTAERTVFTIEEASPIIAALESFIRGQVPR